MDFILSAFKISLCVVFQFNLNIVQGAVLSTAIPAIVFLAVPVVFVCVSVCVVDLCPWCELVVCVCVEGVGADEGCKCKLHNEVEARLVLRLQQA